MDMNLIMQNLAVCIMLTSIIALFFVVKYIYHALQKITAPSLNQVIYQDTQLKKTIAGIEISMYSVGIVFSTTYVLTLVS